MNAPLAAAALRWLEHTLLPMALSAARLPAETSLDHLLGLGLPQPDIATHAAMSAQDHCGDLVLLGAVMVASELSREPRAHEICRCIKGLMWRDAMELAFARDLAFDTNLEGIDNTEYELRYEAAQQVWTRWQETDERVASETDAFFLKCSADAMLV